MSKVCSVCGKGRTYGHAVSHSNIKTNRSWMPNLKKVRVKSGNSVEQVYVCTHCLRANKVERA
ncbi:MAG: 50S ribosomal protein L28 [Clostridia bacterium]|nr:50S ribosomal protein L28 [Clostridia bacterium]